MFPVHVTLVARALVVHQALAGARMCLQDAAMPACGCGYLPIDTAVPCMHVRIQG
jgi:hypothetical protein